MKANMIKKIFIEDISREQIKELEISMRITVKQLKKEIEKLFKLNYSLEHYALRVRNNGRALKLISECDENMTLFELHFRPECHVIFGKPTNYGVVASYLKEINIKFIKDQKIKINLYNPYNEKEKELFGLLKLCLLKEISSKFSEEQIKKLPELLSYIIQILKNGYIIDSIPEEDIKKVLEKIKGSNILNFSKYIDKTINSNEINMLLQYIDKDYLENLYDIKNRLSNYNEHMKLFEKDFEIRKRNSIFEFSIISLVVREREDFQIFEKERKCCPNRVDKILYHGTSIEFINYENKIVKPIPWILTGQFRKSTYSCQHGEGVYFTDTLDYCCFYGGKHSNRENGNVIPNINHTFTLIVSSTYYDKNKLRKVKDSSYTPKKNEINFAYTDSFFETIDDYPDKTKFYGTEFVIWELTQICPFIGAKLKRKEYCVIWRDNNFSSKPVYNKEYDEIFKKFFNERMKYIEQYSEQNIYPCETTEEALELIKKKKYNKIILISNVGTDLGGKKFIDEARKIIGNDVIALFLAYNIGHLDWIKNYSNALFSNEPSFYEDYLECFSENHSDNYKEILKLKEKIENHYNVKFNFNDNFLEFPNFKCDGKYSDLRF